MRSGHLPTLDLVAAEQRGRSETHTTVGSQYTTDYVGIQLNIPLFAGGGTSAQTSQARARAERVRQTLERRVARRWPKPVACFWLSTRASNTRRPWQAVHSSEEATVGEHRRVCKPERARWLTCWMPKGGWRMPGGNTRSPCSLWPHRHGLRLAAIDHQHRLAAHDAGQADLLRHRHG